MTSDKPFEMENESANVSSANAQATGERALSFPSKKPLEENRVFSRTVEDKEWALRCQHRRGRYLCLECSGLAAIDIEKWNPFRTMEKHIYRIPGPRMGNEDVFTAVRISRKDCVLVSRPNKSVAGSQISFWYGCHACNDMIEHSAAKAELTACPSCAGPIFAIAEPFQPWVFSSEIGNGGTDGETDRLQCGSGHSTVDAVTLDFLTDPNSGFQNGGTGYLRIPLDVARSTRAKAPEWLSSRAEFLGTFKKPRSERAERILFRFYVEGETDEQIAQSMGWAKNSVKKERRQLLERGDNFFRILALKHPPCPAISEREMDEVQEEAWMS